MSLPCIIGIEGTSLTSDEAAAIRHFQPAGFVLFSRNIENLEQVRQLTASLRELSNHTPIIAIDQEGGRVVRTGALGLELPSARALSRTGDSKYIARAARINAHTLLMMGVNVNFAPVLDICHDDSVANALPSRCWGSTPQQVISNAGMFNANLARYGISGCGKHFPGMGLAGSDPHHDLPLISAGMDELFNSELQPFLALAHRLPALMTAHIMLPEIDPDYPATLSKRIIRDLLRNQLAYKGIVLTDDLCMGAISKRLDIAEAARMALEAECDLPLLCHDALRYLADFSEQTNKLPASLENERSKRLERFTRKLSAPFKLDLRLWDTLLAESRQLASLIETEGTDLNSPVARY